MQNIDFKKPTYTRQSCPHHHALMSDVLRLPGILKIVCKLLLLLGSLVADISTALLDANPK
jgi:hypothetical protein